MTNNSKQIFLPILGARRVHWLILFLISFVCVGCELFQTKKKSCHPVSVSEWKRIQSDHAYSLRKIKEEDRLLRRDFSRFNARGKWRERGYFSAKEFDLMESLVLRLIEMQGHLLEILDRETLGRTCYRTTREPTSKNYKKAKSLLLSQASWVVEMYRHDPLAKRLMNQEFTRSNIPKHTYDQLEDLLKLDVFRHVDSFGRKLEDQLEASSYSVQADLFFQISRVKNPTSPLIRFSKKQKKQMISMLQPGDILVSYTSGYMSSLFIPGVFKHSMIYVGDVEDRKKIGLFSSDIHILGCEGKSKIIQQKMRITKTHCGLRANLIEAVAEGVKLSQLEFIMDTHINRLAVIRPHLSHRDRLMYLAKAFSYLGQEYDFNFDFMDASRQVCTEVIYRSLDGLNGIHFPLYTHAGKRSMTADELLYYALYTQPRAFEVIAYATESQKKKNHAAVIYTGKVAEGHLKEILRK